MKSYKIKSSKQNKKTGIIVLLLFSAGIIIGGIFYINEKKSQSPDIKDSEQTSQNEKVNSETSKEPAATPARDGGALDTGGQDSTPSGVSSSSESGKITVYQPSPNQLLTSGTVISGASSYSEISYRIIDDNIGVVGQGSLKVVNGKFSGTFSFSSSGQEGRLDVFRALEDGREIDIIEIPVRYK